MNLSKEVMLESLAKRLQFYERCKAKNTAPSSIDNKIKETKEMIVDAVLKEYIDDFS